MAAEQIAVQRINSADLTSFRGKYVSMIGMVESVDTQNGRSFRLKSPDQKSILIHAKKELQQELQGYVEVEGFVTKDNAIDCHKYHSFEGSLVGQFNMDALSEVTKLCILYPNHYQSGDVDAL